MLCINFDILSPILLECQTILDYFFTAITVTIPSTDI